MTDRELLEFIASQVNTLAKELNEFREETNTRFDALETN